jgi:hypothetical protein
LHCSQLVDSRLRVTVRVTPAYTMVLGHTAHVVAAGAGIGVAETPEVRYPAAESIMAMVL